MPFIKSLGSNKFILILIACFIEKKEFDEYQLNICVFYVTFWHVQS